MSLNVTSELRWENRRINLFNHGWTRMDTDGFKAVGNTTAKIRAGC